MIAHYIVVVMNNNAKVNANVNSRVVAAIGIQTGVTGVLLSYQQQ